MVQERLPANGVEWFSTPENQEVAEKPLNQLLEEAFSAPKVELEKNGSSQELINLRLRYGEQLRAWWQSKRETFFCFQREGKLVERFGESWARIGEEEISVQQMGVYEMEEKQVLVIAQKTPLGESKITISASKETGVDIFIHPPKLGAQFWKIPEGGIRTYWEVVFRGPAISTMTRTTFHDHPNFELPYVKHTETIDASLFGVDLGR